MYNVLTCNRTQQTYFLIFYCKFGVIENNLVSSNTLRPVPLSQQMTYSVKSTSLGPVQRIRKN